MFLCSLGFSVSSVCSVVRTSAVSLASAPSTRAPRPRDGIIDRHAGNPDEPDSRAKEARGRPAACAEAGLAEGARARIGELSPAQGTDAHTRPAYRLRGSELSEHR